MEDSVVTYNFGGGQAKDHLSPIWFNLVTKILMWFIIKITLLYIYNQQNYFYLK